MHSKVRSLVTAGWLAAGMLGCGHTQSTPQSDEAQSDRSSTHALTSAPMPADEAKPTQAESEALATPHAQTKVAMADHFQITLWARDAVVEGDLEALRAPLRALADYRYDSFPSSWMNDIKQLQSAARRTSEAQTLTAAAAGVAAIGRSCGSCHRNHGHSLSRDPVGAEAAATVSDPVRARMHRHFWATERLWEGLMAPSDRAWQAGASALAHAPAQAPKARPHGPAGFAKSLTHLRELGARATTAESLDERAELYGLALATCADCHSNSEAFE
jgi:hypothetical protein